MDTQLFKAAYNESRNGCEYFTRHMFNSKMRYSDGVKTCADIGCHWLLDIIATEVVPVVRKDPNGNLGIFYANVLDGKADLRVELSDGVSSWDRHIEYTDMPDGKWTFYLANEGGEIAMILPNEY